MLQILTGDLREAARQTKGAGAVGSVASAQSLDAPARRTGQAVVNDPS